MTTEYKSQRPHELKLEDQGHIEAAFAQLNVIDHDGDVLVPGAFPAKEVPLSAFGHSSWEGAPPVGRGSIEERGDWAVFSGGFFMDTTHGHDAFLTLKGLGDLAEFSFGYDVIDGGPSTFNGTAVREIRSLDVMEVSNVLKGAGLDTHLLAIKSDVPESDASYVEQMDRTSDRLSTLIEWAQNRKAARESEGRDLSTKDAERLDATASKLLAHLDAIGSLLATAESAERAEDMTLMVEIERLRLG